MKHKAIVPLEKIRRSGSKISNTENDLKTTVGDCVDYIHLFHNKDLRLSREHGNKISVLVER